MAGKVSTKLTPGEKSDILDYLAKGKTIAACAREFGRNETTIRDFIRTMRPTTSLAKATLLARASEVVEHVLDKGEVKDLIDILTRPNVGVLDPAPGTKTGGGSTGIGIAISVTAGSLPAVNEVEFIEGQTREKAVLDQPRGGSNQLMADNTVVAEIYKGV